MRSCQISHFVIFYISFWAGSAALGCQSGWFGSKCQFQCRCWPSPNCDATTGQCPSASRCATGWFGRSCQYQDLVIEPTVTINTSPSQRSYTWIYDRNDTTCNTDVNLQSVTIAWSTALPFTWLRLTINDVAYLGTLSVSFITRTIPSNTTCVDRNIYVINTKTIDIRCKVIVNTTSVIVKGQGIKSLCSLYISGGRNVALRQSAAQTSTYTDPGKDTSASAAVDGNKSSLFSSNTCSHTDDPNPSWAVTFDHDKILNRIHVYNRIDNCNCGARLKHFIVQTFDAEKTVFRYQDQSDTVLRIYQVTVTEKESTIPVSGLKINFTNSTVSNILTLCEVEAFGDCVPGSWGLECHNCNNTCNSECNVETGACQVCNGFINPPYCSKECDKGKWGLNCSNICKAACWNNSCNHFTGECDEGCNGYKDFPNCTLECEPGATGLNCIKHCDNCYNRSCYINIRLCDMGCDGYSNPPNCTIPCNQSFWGNNCTHRCKENCFNTSCDKHTGLCDKGCNGYINPPDCDVCAPGLWGSGCNIGCQENCYDTSCNPQTGVCVKGCNGYLNPPICNIQCAQGFWGPNCTNRCQENCLRTSCDKITGFCNLGCNGYSNFPICDKDEREPNSQNKITGLGVGLGVSCAFIIAIIIVMCVLIRRVKQPILVRGPYENSVTDKIYDHINIVNEYSPEYQQPGTSSQQENMTIKMEPRVRDPQEEQSNPNDLKTTTEYESI